MKLIDDNNEQILNEEKWTDLVNSLDMFSDDFMDEEREQPEQKEREDLFIISLPFSLVQLVLFPHP